MKQSTSPLPFGARNYSLLLLSIAVIGLGFVLIALDTTEYGFGVLGLTIGPITILSGFGVAFFAIIYLGNDS